MKYNEKDIPLFKEVICSHCNSNELICKNKQDDKHWFLMCPKFFLWYNGYAWGGMGYTKRVTPKRTKFEE